jgi:hypothetical protein
MDALAMNAILAMSFDGATTLAMDASKALALHIFNRGGRAYASGYQTHDCGDCRHYDRYCHSCGVRLSYAYARHKKRVCCMALLACSITVLSRARHINCLAWL